MKDVGNINKYTTEKIKIDGQENSYKYLWRVVTVDFLFPYCSIEIRTGIAITKEAFKK